MTKRKTFTPRALKDREGIQSYSSLSGNYFKVAQELRERSRINKEGMPGHYYVFPSVIMYVASLEAFMSEFLAFVRFSNENSLKLLALKKQSDQYADFKTWIREVFITFNRTGVEIDYGGEFFQNVIALKELRNSVAHYNPDFVSHAEWPKRLQQVFSKSKIDVLNSGWTTNFSRPEVADWAYDITKGTISEFCNTSGCQNPFQAEYPFGWESSKP
jgi:hypothetical protein